MSNTGSACQLRIKQITPLRTDCLPWASVYWTWLRRQHSGWSKGGILCSVTASAIPNTEPFNPGIFKLTATQVLFRKRLEKKNHTIFEGTIQSQVCN